MVALPIVVRELGRVARRSDLFWWRVIGAGLGLAAMGWILVVGSAGLPTAMQGQGLFQGIANVVFLYCLLAGPSLVAGSVSSERRNGTLGLLFLTDLKGYDILLGKLAAGCLSALSTVLSIVPVLAVAMLLGGVSLLDVGLKLITWVATLLCSASLALWISSYCVDDRKAVFGSTVAAAVLGYGAYLPAIALRDAGLVSFGDAIVVLSAGNANATSQSNALGGFGSQWTTWIGSIVFLAIVMTGAIVSASRHIQTLAGGAPQSRWRQRWENLTHQWSFGAPEQRQGRRSRLLDLSPFLWLNSRHQRKKTYMRVFLGAMILIWIVTTTGLPSLKTDWRFNLGAFFLIAAFLKNFWMSETAERLLEDRQAGALELIFTTPVTPLEFAQGQAMALRQTFGDSIVGFAALQTAWLVWMLTSTITLDVHLAILGLVVLWVVLVVDLWAILWLGLWNALIRQSASKAANAVAMVIGVWPWVCTFTSIGILNYIELQSSNPGAVSTLSPIVHGGLFTFFSLLFAGVSGMRAKRRFLFSFRVVAAEGLKAALVERALAIAPILRPSQPTAPVGGNRGAEAPSDRPSEVDPEVLPVSRPWYRRHILSLAIAVVLGSAIAAFSIHRLHWQRKLEALQAALAQSGRPTTLADINSVEGTDEPVLPSTALLDTLKRYQLPRPVERMGVRQMLADPGGEAFVAATNFIVAWKNLPDVLSEAAALPVRPRRLDPGVFGFNGNPLTSQLSRLLKIAAVRGQMQLERGDSTGAWTTLIQSFRVVRFVHARAPVLTSDMYFANESSSHAFDLFQYLIDHEPVPETLRPQLESVLRDLDSMKILQRNLEFARISSLDLDRTTTVLGAGSWRMLGLNIPKSEAFIKGAGTFIGLRAREQYAAYAELTALADASFEPEPAVATRARSVDSSQSLVRSVLYPLGPVMVSSSANLVNMDRTLAMRSRLARLVIRADSHRQRTKRWPATLDDLIPAAEESQWRNPLNGARFNFEVNEAMNTVWISDVATDKSTSTQPRRTNRSRRLPSDGFGIDRLPASARPN